MQPRPKSPAPKRALPNKPLPSRPLPSKPLPQQIQQKPAIIQQPQMLQINNNIQQQQQQQQYEQQQYEQQQYEQQQYDQQQQQEYESQQEPESAPDPETKPEPKIEIEIEPESNPEAIEEKQENNNWYKQRTKPQRSFKAAKTCKLLLDDKKNKVKKVKLFQTFDKFFVAEGNDKNRGFRVASICNNEFGKAFEKMGIDSGWKVTKIGNKPLQYISFPMLKNQLISAGQKAGDKGYYLIFDANPIKQPEHKQNDNNDGLPQLTAAPVSLGKNSVELIKSYNDHKVVIIKHSLDKYIDFEAVKGPKGYKICAFKPKFGNDLKQYGIDINWRVIKLGEKDVSNMFTQIIKTNLDVEWRNNKANGITITFGQPL